MNIQSAKLKGVKIITPITIYEDFRGEYIETYNKRIYNESGINEEFIQDDISISSQNVLRGIHGDQKTTKLVSCLFGKFYLLIVNNDPSSPDFKKWMSLTLSDINKRQVLIPPKFGNGHLVLSQTAIFNYKQTTEYDREGQFTIKWDDPSFNFWWPVKFPILSERDAGL